MRKITFDKVEVEIQGKYQTPIERKWSIPTNHHLEKAVVTQVGDLVEDIKKGDTVLFLTVSANKVSGNKAYLREKEVLFILNEDESFSTIGDDVHIYDVNEEQSLRDSGLILPSMTKEGVLQKAKVISVNPNKNELGLKKDQSVWYKKKNGERVLVYNDTVLLHEPQVIYKENVKDTND